MIRTVSHRSHRQRQSSVSFLLFEPGCQVSRTLLSLPHLTYLIASARACFAAGASAARHPAPSHPRQTASPDLDAARQSDSAVAMADLKHPDASKTDIPGLGLPDHLPAAIDGPAFAHPSGKQGYGRLGQVLRVLAFAVYFPLCCLGSGAPSLKARPIAG